MSRPWPKGLHFMNGEVKGETISLVYREPFDNLEPFDDIDEYDIIYRPYTLLEWEEVVHELIGTVGALDAWLSAGEHTVEER